MLTNFFSFVEVLDNLYDLLGQLFYVHSMNGMLVSWKSKEVIDYFY